MNKEQIFYDSAKAQAEEQDVRRQHFDTMAVGGLGFAAVLVGLTSFTVEHWAKWSIAPFSVMLLTFSGVAFSTLNELRLRGWKKQPKLEDLEEHIENPEYEDDAMLVSWTARQIMHAVRENEDHLTKKARFLQRAYCALALHVGATAAFVASIAVRTSISS